MVVLYYTQNRNLNDYLLLWSVCTDVSIYAVGDYCRCLLLLKTDHALGTTEARLFYTISLDTVILYTVKALSHNSHQGFNTRL